MRHQRGQGLIALFIVMLLALAFFFAVCFDDDDTDNDLGVLGRVELVSHEYDDDCWDDDCGDYYDRRDPGDEGGYRDGDRRAGISPGPFDRSPVEDSFNPTFCVMPNSCASQGESGRERDDERRA